MNKPKTILIYSNGAATGDAAVTLPMLAALKSALPETELIWLCEKADVFLTSMQSLAKGLLSEVATLDPAAGHDLRPLLARRFDVVLDLRHYLKRTLWLKWKTRHAVFISPTWGYAFSDRKPPKGTPVSPRVFDRMMVWGSLASGEILKPKPFEHIDPKAIRTALDLLPGDRRYVGFYPGASSEKKRWPLDQFIALARRQSQRGFVPVFIVGPGEREMVPILQSALPDAILPLSQAPDLGPALTIAVAARLDGSVVNDGGGCHLLALGGKPMVCLFRAGYVRDKYTPVVSPAVGLSPEDFDGGRSGVVADIPVSAVEAALDKYLLT